MAQAIIWSKSAALDLEQVVEYIARDSPTYAAVVADRIMGSIEHLCEFPMMGRVVPEFDQPSLREVIVYSYRVIYRTEVSRVLIAAIIHGARDLGVAIGYRVS